MATSGRITGADMIPGIYFLLGGATTAAILCNHQVKRHKTRHKAHITRYLSAQWSFWRNTRDTCVPRVSSKREAEVRLHGQDSDRILIFFGVIAGAVEKHPKQGKIVNVNWHGFHGKQRSDVLRLPESRSTTCLVCATFIEVALHMYVFIFFQMLFFLLIFFQGQTRKALKQSK